MYVAHRVETDDAVTFVQKALRQVKSDKAGRPGHERGFRGGHARPPPRDQAADVSGQRLPDKHERRRERRTNAAPAEPNAPWAAFRS